jgi:hypothetical protein
MGHVDNFRADGWIVEILTESGTPSFYPRVEVPIKEDMLSACQNSALTIVLYAK